MIEALQRFHIDPERIYRERDASASIGHAYLNPNVLHEEHVDGQLLRYAAATQLRRAGAHSLLLDDVRSARQLFHEAAEIYAASGVAYGSLLEHLGFGESTPRSGRERDVIHASDAFYLWDVAATRDLDTDRFMVLRRRLEPFRADAIGALGVPAGIYLDIYDAVRVESVNSSNRLSSIAEAALPLLSAYEAAIRRARADRFHWERLATPFHPVEPDVMALLVALHSAIRQQLDIPVSTVIGRIPLSEDTQSLLRECLRQYGAWEGEGRTRSR